MKIIREIDNSDKTREVFLNASIWVVIISGLFYACFWVIYDQIDVSLYCIAISLVGTILLYYKRLGISFMVCSSLILTSGTIFVLIINLLFVQFIPLLLIYFCIVPITALLLMGRQNTIPWVIICFISIILVGIFAERFQIQIVKSAEVLLAINTIQTLTIFIVLLFLVYLYDVRNNKLINYLTKQNKIIKEAQIAIENSQKYKDNFLSSISHEIRTPMNAIKGISEILEQSPCGKGEEKELIVALNNSSIHLLNIINDLLDLGKIDERKLNILNLDIDLRDTIMIGTKMVQFAANEKKIDLNIKIDPSLPRYIKGDPHRLNQILVNILNNAVKFTNEGSVTLIVSKIKDNETIEFKVVDTGIGIPKESHKIIFERFKQSNDYISMKYGGTGLGLNIAQGLIELMGGTIWLESELGIGTTFFIQIPLVESKGNHLNNTSDSVETNIFEDKTYNILIVDDNNMNLMVAEKLLQKSFAKVKIFRAVNGEDAINVLMQNPIINMVLMDLQMPIMDGKTATSKIREMEDFKTLPIIAMSAAINQQEIQECMNVGMNDFIGKPFDKNSLLMLIKKHIQ